MIVKFGTKELGEYIHIDLSFIQNASIINIPRARSVKLWDVSQLGGGHYRVTITTLKKFKSSQPKESLDIQAMVSFFQNLVENLPSSGTLKLDDTTIFNEVILERASIVGISGQGVHFRFEFISKYNS